MWLVPALAVGALLAARGDAAAADKCAAAKLRGVAAREATVLRCLAKVAARADSSDLAACEAAAAAAFAAAFSKAGVCQGTQGRCEQIADGCVAAITAAFADFFPSRCESVKRKAAATLAAKLLGCHTKAAQSGRPLKSGCEDRARRKFDGAMRRAGACPDGGTPRDLVESTCVTPAVSPGAGGTVTGACPNDAGTTTTVPNAETTSTSLRPTTSTSLRPTTSSSSSSTTTSSTSSTSSSVVTTTSTSSTTTTATSSTTSTTT
jgi:hypothetical protein